MLRIFPQKFRNYWGKMVKVKICGLTDVEDAKICVSLGVDFIGFVFAESPRRITKEDAKGIIAGLPPAVKKVGVFVNEVKDIGEDIARYCWLDVLQFHGDESPNYCLHFGGFEIFKAFRLRAKEDLVPVPEYRVDAYLLDAFVPGKSGGTGESFDWDLAIEAKKFGRPIVLSGGLDAGNVGEAIRKVRPEIVDVSSGVESAPGRKDADKLKEFVESVRGGYVT